MPNAMPKDQKKDNRRPDSTKTSKDKEAEVDGENSGGETDSKTIRRRPHPDDRSDSPN